MMFRTVAAGCWPFTAVPAACFRTVVRGGTAGSATGGQGGGAQQATVRPTWPAGAELSLSNVTATTATLDWPEATDDMAVTEYVLTRDGTEVSRASPSASRGAFATTRIPSRMDFR